MTKTQKPFLKWVGGKTQLLNNIRAMVPDRINNYHEPFLGGGSVLLAVLTLREEGKLKIDGRVYASDLNSNLIDAYKAVQKDKDRLFTHIGEFISTYSSITDEKVIRAPVTHDEAITSKESYYYWMRARYNAMSEPSIEKSALFMVLNKTCFRGIYREGPNGFNVPFGHYKRTPTVITRSELDAISDLIKDVEFRACDFKESLSSIQPDDFVYLDPPYVPETSTSFVAYTSKGFGPEQHKALFSCIHKLKGPKFVMSNSNTRYVRESFKDYKHEELVARRAVNSKKPDSKTTELLVYN